MTINDILPRSGMRARLPAPLPARITIVTHGACGETHWPAASAGPAAPIFGSIFLEKKKINCAKIPMSFRIRSKQHQDALLREFS
jgi:hypothetical protein